MRTSCPPTLGAHYPSMMARSLLRSSLAPGAKPRTQLSEDGSSHPTVVSTPRVSSAVLDPEVWEKGCPRWLWFPEPP